jgi:RHS repeat-associated protein
VLSDGTDTYVYGHERLRVLGGPWYVGDALGSVRQTLDDAGAVLATTNYDPWGTPQGTLSAPFGFTGELHSAGQVYLRARWYAPGNGTFTSRDPFAGFAEMPYSLHAYQYAYSDPVRWTDPSGRCVLPDGTPCLRPGDAAIPCGQSGQPPCVEPTPTAVPTPTGNPLLAGGGFFATKPHPALIAIGACLLAVGIGSVTVQTRPQTEYVVVPELLRPAPEPDPTVTVEMPPIWSPVPTPMPTPTPTPQPAFVNLDTGTAIAFIAEGSPLLPQLEAYVQDKQMVMTRTAFLEFVRIVTTIGGVSERTRAGTFLQRVNEVDDDPSDRALNLRVTGGLGPNDIVIFGTADRLGIITMSADERAVRASSNQGVDFVVYLHPPVPLTGR